ncbi:hypothetical protein HID58_033560 [Brassica napus]|uniref:Nudix hydrolase n=1 Tax=Brassica napus TaxID=3708 RepID=A0ABQ8BZJ8_BRANA|nr:hypothetical protein HID58_033560 [Brassica napus]
MMISRVAKSHGLIRLLKKPCDGCLRSPLFLRFPADGFSTFRSYSLTRSRFMSTDPMVGEEARNGGVTMLPAVEDKYGGVMTEMTRPMDPSAFSALLRSSLSNWTLQVTLPLVRFDLIKTEFVITGLFHRIIENVVGKKGVWIKLPRQLIGLAETAVKVLLLLPFVRGILVSSRGEKLLDACVLDSKTRPYPSFQCISPCWHSRLCSKPQERGEMRFSVSLWK